MNQKGRTPDEKFLIQLYKIAHANGDPYVSVEIKTIADKIGHKETAVKNIVKHLAQANFIKKVDATSVLITDRGYSFVLDELEG